MNIIDKFKNLYWRFIKSPEAYARYLGVKIGSNCLIDTRFWPSEPYLITIGDYVQITSRVSIFTLGGGNAVRRIDPDFDCFGKVVIEDWAYIGSQSVIMPGVTVGEGAIVAAGSVVTKSVPAYTVVGGNPAKFICSIDEYYKKNIKFNVLTKKMSAQDKKKILLSLPDDRFIIKPMLKDKSR